MTNFQGELSGGGTEGEEMNFESCMQNSSKLWSRATFAAVPAVIAATPGQVSGEAFACEEGSGFLERASAIVFDSPA